ncbi:MAG: DUF2283 domain-containing protein [Bacteriovorax sp.]|nr:DUF2283 domain-containing protein [Bacteriovorax sp.]
MKVKYDKDTDTLRITFTESIIEESDEEKPGIILDYDKDGNIVGVEILSASKKMKDPSKIELDIAG